MAVDENLWNESFGALDPGSLPKWPCPSCGKNALELDKKKIIYIQNKNQYRPEDFKKEDFEESIWLGIFKTIATVYEKFQYFQHKFVGFLTCKECGESVSFIGRAEIPIELSGQHTYRTTQLYPEYFSPPLHFFPLDKRYPVSIQQNLIRSFSFAFNDAASAASAIRQSIESLLDEVKIENEDDRGRRLSLFDRIQKLGGENKQHADLFDAIRFLGNEGSHSGRVNRSDLIAAYVVVDHILDEIFIRPEVRNKVLKSGRDLTNAYKPDSKQVKDLSKANEKQRGPMV